MGQKKYFPRRRFRDTYRCPYLGTSVSVPQNNSPCGVTIDIITAKIEYTFNFAERPVGKAYFFIFNISAVLPSSVN
jgi:hypothetical protein